MTSQHMAALAYAVVRVLVKDAGATFTDRKAVELNRYLPPSPINNLDTFVADCVWISQIFWIFKKLL